MNLTIVTINYNSSENTIKLLKSLENQTDKDFSVIVVENNSEPDQKSILKNFRTEATNVVLIENDQNLGFSGGNNVGIKKAIENGSNWVLLLNNDAWVETDFIARLKANLDAKEGIMGLAIDEAHSTSSGQAKTVYAGKIEWLRPTLKHESRITNHDSYLYAIGGAVTIQRDVFNKIGFLDEKYFLYFEDADFSFRAREAGIHVGFIPEIKISHTVSSSAKKLGSPMLLRYHYRNALYFNLKNGPWYIKFLVWPWSCWIAGKQVLKLIMGRNRNQSKAILTAVMDFYKNNYGKLHV